MPLTKDKWPYVYFYDVRQTKQVKVNVSDCKLKSGSTKGHGPGKYFQIIAVTPGKLDYNLYRFLSEDKYNEYKMKMKQSPKASPKKSSCNRRRSKKVTKSKCKKSKKCSWVKGVKGVRKGYCKKSKK